jgi:hypothetical protein
MNEPHRDQARRAIGLLSKAKPSVESSIRCDRCRATCRDCAPRIASVGREEPSRAAESFGSAYPSGTADRTNGSRRQVEPRDRPEPVLSHRTVGFHLYRLFPKLGITSRNELRDALDVQELSA